MILDEAIVSLLKADPGIAALVAGRVTPVISPESIGTVDMPSLTYLIVDSVRDYAMGGESKTALARVQLDSWGNHYLDVRNLAAAVRTAISGFKGTVGSVVFQGIFLQDGHAPWEPNAKLYRAMQEAFVHYVEN